MNPDNLRPSTEALEFVKAILRAAGKPCGVICHGPWTLVEVDVRGRTLTSIPSVRTDIRNAGGTVVDEEVVCDRALVSSRDPDDFPAFCAKLSRSSPRASTRFAAPERPRSRELVEKGAA